MVPSESPPVYHNALVSQGRFLQCEYVYSVISIIRALIGHYKLSRQHCLLVCFV